MPQPEATTAPPGAANPLDKRTCAYCKAEKVVTPETWPYRRGREGHYQAHGARCLECEKVRKAKYEETRDDIAKRLGSPPAPDKDKANGKKPTKLDIDAALKAGGIALNMVAPAVLARIMMYLDDEESVHHVWALEFFAQRILPRKLYEELGGQAAGVGALNDKRPQFIVNVLPAVLGAQGQVYENEIPALPREVAPEPDEQPDPFS
jgi:hypothetical protein